MLLIRGEKRYLAYTLFLASPRIRDLLSDGTVVNVCTFVTPPWHAVQNG